MSRCWTCRPRRLKCDGAVPHCLKCAERGVQCLGYRKPFTWVPGSTRKGLARPDHPRYASHTDSDSTESSGGGVEELGVKAQVSDLWKAPTDPILQDMNRTSRFLIDYFSKRYCPVMVLFDDGRNPHRALISHVGSSPAVLSAMMAVASCHLMHSITGSPIMTAGSEGLLKTYKSSLKSANSRLPDIGSLYLSKPNMLQLYMKFKQNSLHLLSVALSDPDTATSHSTLAAVILMAFGNLIECGSGSWNIHLEGAKRLLAAGASTAKTPAASGDLGDLMDDIDMIQSLGSSLTRPGLLTGPEGETIMAKLRGRHEDHLTIVGCPRFFFTAIEFFASQRQLHTELSPSTLDEVLCKVREFDVREWAETLMTRNRTATSFSVDDLYHTGLIFKLTTSLYACRVISTITNDTHWPGPSIDDIISAYAFLEREDAQLLKSVIWPTVVTGAASTSPSHREWVLRTLDRTWHVTLSAHVANAAIVLRRVWDKHDQRQCMPRPDSGVVERDGWDWVAELGSLDEPWLFV